MVRKKHKKTKIRSLSSLILNLSPPLPHPAWSIGVDNDHDPGFVVNSVYSERYIYMLFHTPFEALTERGRVTGAPGDMLVLSPGYHQWHRGVGSRPFVNDWIHIDGKMGSSWVKKYDIPINQLFRVLKTDYVSRLLKEIIAEITEEQPFYCDQVEHRVKELLRLTGRNHCIDQRSKLSPSRDIHYQNFCLIRHAIRQSFLEEWPLERMAHMAHLSKSRFSSLYRDIFGISPMGDLIAVRMSEARRWLASGGMTTAEAATRSGYNDINYFSRLFKKHSGITPGAFARQFTLGAEQSDFFARDTTSRKKNNLL